MSPRKRSQQPADVADALDEIVHMLEESWKDLSRLRIYKAEFDRLAEHLQHYDGSMYIQQWYVADLLMGCRRMVDTGADVLSIRRALYLLRRIADDVAGDDIAACRHRNGGHRSLVREVENDLQHMLGPRKAGDPLGVRAVQHDLDTIGDVPDRVHRLATDSVAHRFDKPPANLARSPTWADVAKLLEDLNDICGRWSWLLCNVMLADPPDSPESPAILKALELFDFEEYVEAVDAEIRRLGPNVRSFEDVEARARIEYRFD